MMVTGWYLYLRNTSIKGPFLASSMRHLGPWAISCFSSTSRASISRLVCSCASRAFLSASKALACATSVSFSSNLRTLSSALAARYSNSPSPPIPPTTIVIARPLYHFWDRITHGRGDLIRVRTLTVCVGMRWSGSKYSIMAPTKRTTVDHIRPQKYESAVLVNSVRADSLSATNSVTNYSHDQLPLWAVWVCIAQFILFVMYSSLTDGVCHSRIHADPSKQNVSVLTRGACGKSRQNGESPATGREACPTHPNFHGARYGFISH